MNLIDWQAYEDGSLSESARAEADRLLAECPLAKAELQGLRRLRNAIREAGLSEPIPERALRDKLRKASQAHKGIEPRLGLVLLAAAAVLAALFLAPQSLNFLPPAAQPNDPAAARAYAFEKSNIDTPVPLLNGLASFQKVHCGPDWACFDYSLRGRLVHVHVQRYRNQSMKGNIREIDGTKFYISESVDWIQNGLLYRAMGSDPEDMKELARRAAREIATRA